MSTENLYSTAEMAGRLSVKFYRIEYLLATRQICEPALRIAGRRVWTEQEIQEVAEVIKELGSGTVDRRRGPESRFV